MRTILLASVLLLLSTITALAQPALRLDGFVRDTTDAAVPYCTVAMLDAQDSTLLGGVATDVEGRYLLNVDRPRRLLLRYEHLAYETEYRAVDVAASSTLPDVVLAPSAQTIDDVVVTAQHVKYRAGRYEVNMINNPIARNRSLADAMNLLPAVKVRDGAVSIKGQAVSVIYIDDRIVTDAAELAALRAEDIKSIEVQQRAGAAYSATAQGGVIRIKLKKTESGSFYGSLGGNVSASKHSFKSGVSMPFAAQIGRWGLYNYIDAGYQRSDSGTATDAEYRDNGYNMQTVEDEHSQYRHVNELLSALCDITPRHRLGVSGQIYATENLRGNDSETTFTGAVPEESFSRYSYDGAVYNRQYIGSLNYRWQVDTLGSELSFRAGYAHRNIDKNYDYDTRGYLLQTDAEPSSRFLERERYSPVGDALSARLDLDKVFSDARLLSVGVSYDMHNVSNDNRVYDFTDGAWQPDTRQTMFFHDRTHSSAAYADWSDGYGRFSYEAGLRLQWDRIAYRAAEGNGYRNRDYLRLFPTLNLSYNINEQRGTNISLSVGRYSGSLPSNEELSPRRTWQSQYSYFVGNENLDPTHGYDLDLTYILRGRWIFSYMLDRGFWAGTVTHFDPDDGRVVYTTTENGADNLTHTLFVEYNAPITKWMRLDAYVSAWWARRHFNDWAESTSSAMFYLALDFEPVKTMGLSLRFQAATPRQELETRTNGTAQLSAKIYKTFCRNRLYLSLDFNNILYTPLKQTTSKLDGGYFSTLRSRYGSRDFFARFSVVWHFNHRAKKSVEITESLLQTGEVLK